MREVFQDSTDEWGIRLQLIGEAPISTKQKQADAVSLSERVVSFPWPRTPIYSLFLPDFFAAAQRLRIASAILFRDAADMIRRFGALAAGVDLFALPGGRPRRLAALRPPTPSSACIAASSLLRSSLSCCTISLTFIAIS